MQLFNLRYVQRLRVSPAQAWSFFCDPRNLVTITPPWLNFVIVSGGDGAMYPGQIIAYRVHPFLGIPVNWVTEITHVEFGRRFVDEQRIGPYRLWHHQHHFEEIDGGVEVRDEINYVLGVPLAGALVNRAFVAPRLREIFSFRREALSRRFGDL